MKVDFGVDPCFPRSIKEVRNAGKRVLVLPGDLIQTTEVMTDIRKRGTSLFSYCTYPGLFYLIFDGSPLFGLLKIDGFGPTLYNDRLIKKNVE